MNKEKVLIIEDEPILLDVLAKKIESEGYQTFVAKDGEEGLQKIKEEKPDLILLDMLLPKIDGYGVMKKMKEEENEIPILIISNSGQPVDIDKALKMGACDYMVKAELDPAEILEKVSKCLSSREATNEPKEGEGEGEGMKKILIVEDDDFLRQLCIKKLKKENYVIKTANNGKDGLEKIIKEKPNVVLLDVVMPELDGFGVLEKVRAHEDKKVAETPIIILSNLGQESDKERAEKLKANDYLIKANFTTSEIAEKIKKNLK